MIFMSCVFSCFHVCSLLPCGHLKGKGWLFALVCDVYCDLGTSYLVSLDRCGT